MKFTTMKARNRLITGLTIAISTSITTGQMRITEFMYQGTESPPGVSGEFVEFTNIGVAPNDMTNWKFNDNDGPEVDLSAFGIVAPDQSVILCETSAANFNAAWNLGGAVVIIGDNMNNLGRNDEINLLDDNDVIIDRLQYGDQTFPGSVRTNGSSGWPCIQDLGTNDILGWKLSFFGDIQGSAFSSAFNVGNPGTFVMFTCPSDPTGACCESGVCNIRTQADCTGIGLYQGNGTNCSIACPFPTNAMIRITEFMHGPTPREFIEFKNVCAVPVNMLGWSFSDEGRIPGLVSLSAYGTVAPGEVFVLSEASAGDFRDDWNLPGALKAIGGNTANIGVGDEVNIYDNSGALIDRITYGQVACGIDTDGASGWPCPSAVGGNDILEWRESTVKDPQSSTTSLLGDRGNPGVYNQVAACSPGSCCIANVCSIQSQGDCLSQGGLYFGDGSDCTTDPCPPLNNTQIVISEFMYQGNGGEFFEITNLGPTSVSLVGWSFADKCAPVGSFDLSGIGTLDSGQSAIVTDIAAPAFATQWSLAGVPILTLPSSELGRNDTLVVHDAMGAVVDRLDYGDMDFPGTVNTLAQSAWAYPPALGSNQIQSWRLSQVGDEHHSYTSAVGDVGNPGSFVQAPATTTRGILTMTILIGAVGALSLRRPDEVKHKESGEFGPTVDHRTLGWDSVGNKAKRTNILSGVYHDYDYDDAYRLNRAVVDNGSLPSPVITRDTS